MKLILKNSLPSVTLTLVLMQAGILFAADDQRSAQPAGQLPPAPPALTEDQRKVTQILGEAKKKVDGLMQERNEMLQKGASQEEIQAKSAQIMQAQKDTMEFLKKSFPQGLPPMPGMGMPPQAPPKLTPAEQAELDALIAERKQMAMNGAKFEDLQALTEKIQEKYYGRKATPPPIPRPPSPPSAGQTESKST